MKTLHTHTMLLVVLISFFISPSIYSAKKPFVPEDVHSLQIVSGRAGHVKLSPLFRTNDAKGKLIIAKVVKWIKSAKPVDGMVGSGSVKGGLPNYIEMKTNSGELFQVHLAWDCFHGAGWTTCNTVKGEVNIYDKNGGKRVSSSELYNWIKDGWKSEVNKFVTLTGNVSSMNDLIQTKKELPRQLLFASSQNIGFCTDVATVLSEAYIFVKMLACPYRWFGTEAIFF